MRLYDRSRARRSLFDTVTYRIASQLSTALGYVVPKFSHVYEDMHGDLPLLSRVLLDVGRFIEANGVAVALFMAATCHRCASRNFCIGPRAMR